MRAVDGDLAATSIGARWAAPLRLLSLRDGAFALNSTARASPCLMCRLNGSAPLSAAQAHRLALRECGARPAHHLIA